MSTKDTINKLALSLVLLSLCGCAHQYVMKLSNGGKVETPSKPKLKGATYYYKDAKGQTIAIPQSRVLEVEPASAAASENKPFAPAAPYKKHWWHFW